MTAAPRLDALGLSTINGLPAHILLVHAVVVFVPLAALGLVASLRPSVARRFGGWLPAIAGVAFVSVLAAMNAGGWLQNHVPDSQLVRDHTEMAGQLWPFSLLVLVLSLVVWRTAMRSTGVTGASRASQRPASRIAGGTATSVVIGVLAVLVALGSIVQVVRIGDSGSKASWHDHFSKSVVPGAHSS